MAEVVFFFFFGGGGGVIYGSMTGMHLELVLCRCSSACEKLHHWEVWRQDMKFIMSQRESEPLEPLASRQQSIANNKTSQCFEAVLERPKGLYQYCSLECTSNIELWANRLNAGGWQPCMAPSCDFSPRNANRLHLVVVFPSNCIKGRHQAT